VRDPVEARDPECDSGCREENRPEDRVGIPHQIEHQAHEAEQGADDENRPAFRLVQRSVVHVSGQISVGGLLSLPPNPRLLPPSHVVSPTVTGLSAFGNAMATPAVQA